MRTLTIGHLSHGVAQTGGFKHEQQLLEALSLYFSEHKVECTPVTQRANRFYNGLAHLKLQWWSFVNAIFDINIVVSRCALSAILRNVFNARKILIVLHNYDEQDYNGLVLKMYYRLLFWMLRKLPLDHVAIVAVAPFWVNYFEQKVDQNIPVFLFPNLFDQSSYQKYQTTTKKKQIHLGQFSLKNDQRIFTLAKNLTLKGYLCYFNTLFKEEQGVFPDYEIRFGSFESYLKDMAESEYTLAYISINEGWNRVAHESLLVGTPVIGVNKGGLGDLISQSGSLIAETENEFLTIMLNHQGIPYPAAFLASYDTRTQQNWVHPLAEFCNP